MAGVAGFGDLIALLESNEPINVTHHLTSVKTLPPSGQPPNNPQFYGYLTQQAISIAEIASPEYKQIFCSAVTSDTVDIWEDRLLILQRLIKLRQGN
jgi:hypothetical protein